MSAPLSASGSITGATRLRPAAAPAPTLALAIVLAATAARLVVAAITPLSEDEAYYRLWSLRPALGYFDHPPMIAWMIWAGRQIAGDSAFGVRLLPTLATALTSLVTFDLARRIGCAERVAARATIWLNATILVGLGGLLAAPDAPAGLFWTATLWCAARALEGRGAWWLAAGVAAGLSCLSKYSALFLAPGLLLWLAATADGRRALATPWPWLAAVLAAAVFAPNVAWNAGHGWMTFQKQFGRAEVSRFAPAYLAKLVVDQALLLNPLITVFVILAIARRAAAPLLLASAPFAIYLVFHSLHDEVQGQWPAPLYPSLAIAAAAAAETVRPGSWLARLRTAAPIFGFAVAIATFAFIVWPSDGRLPFPDPARAYRGWPAFGAAIERARRAEGAGWIGTPNYGLAAQLADLPAIQAPAVEIYERQRYSFELPAERADFSRPGLVVGDPRLLGAALNRCFASVTPLAPVVRGAGAGAIAYPAYRVAEPRRDVERDGCVKPPDSNSHRP